MGLERIEYKDRESWLAARHKSLGASEIAAALNLSPFSTSLDLWKVKTGRAAPPDLSGNPRVQFGKNAEQHIRGLYLCDHPEYECEYGEFTVLYQTERPYMTATLDGELIERNTSRRGILEIKTAEIGKKVQWENWTGKVPQYYYAQMVHQLLCGGELFQFVNMCAKLRGLSGDSSLRNYEYERADMNTDLLWVLEGAEKFWWYVTHDTMPPMQL